MFETKTWLTKASKRGLISPDAFAVYEANINLIGRMLNAYIKSIGDSDSVRETPPDYLPDFAPSPRTNDY